MAYEEELLRLRGRHLQACSSHALTDKGNKFNASTSLHQLRWTIDLRMDSCRCPWRLREDTEVRLIEKTFVFD